MDCESCRTSVSARLDGEDGGDPEDEVDAHLEQCPACRTWQAEAAALTRGLRVHPAVATPDLVEAVLRTEALPKRRSRFARFALGGVATAQLGLGLVQALGIGGQPHSGGSHLFNESTAWNIALGVALFWVAVRNRGSSGLLPALSVFLLVLAGFSAHDLSVGAVDPGRVASHGLLALGLGFLYAIDRSNRGDDPNPSTAESPDVLGSTTADRPEREHPSRWPHVRRTRLPGPSAQEDAA
ncbi:zf-HC2 domain-containing protein [Parasphingorhabdus pacifica]